MSPTQPPPPLRRPILPHGQREQLQQVSPPSY
jgi:hypothetical protein